MVEVEVDGIGTIELEDSFLKLSKKDQQNFINKIVSDRKNPKKEELSLGDSLAGGARAVGQGLSLGFGDEIEAGLRTGFGLLGDYDKTVKDVRGNIKDFREENPLLSLGLELTGGLATGGLGAGRFAGSKAGQYILGKAGNTGLGATIGAGEGAIAGAGSAEGDAGDIGLGILSGATLGGAFGSALPSVINLGGKALNRGAYAVGLKSDDAIQKGADQKALQALNRAKLTPDDVQKSLDDAVIPDTMIADVGGEATRRLSRASANVSGDGADIATKALDERQLGLGDQIADDVGNVLGGNKSSLEAIEEIAERQKLNANDDYDKAFNLNGKPVTVSSEKLKGFANLPAFDEAFDQARNLAKLDGFSFPDKINDFSKQADFSLKELHYIKMGVDEVLGLAKRGNSKTSIGKGLQRGLNKKRAEFIEIIDNASPKVNGKSAYQTARSKFAGDARMAEAVEEGEKFFKYKPEELDRIIGKMSASEKEAFRIGVADALRSKVETTKDMADAGKKIFGNKRQRNQLKATFPDTKSFELFEKRMTERINQTTTRARTGVNQGSRTAPLTEDIADIGTEALQTVGTRGIIPTALNIGQKLLDGSAMPSKIGSKLAPDLFSTDPAVQRAFLNRLKNLSQSEQQNLIRSARNMARATGTIGNQLGLLTGDR
jgi:hypothetical protein